MTEEGKLKIKEMGATGLNTPAPINYETALPQGLENWYNKKMVLWY